MTNLEPGCAIFELLDVGIPLAWEAGRDLLAAMHCTDEEVAATCQGNDDWDYECLLRRTCDFCCEVQGQRVYFTDLDQPQIISLLKDALWECTCPAKRA